MFSKRLQLLRQPRSETNLAVAVPVLEPIQTHLDTKAKPRDIFGIVAGGKS